MTREEFETKFPPLSEADSKNFGTLHAAALRGDLMLYRASRRADGHAVALVSAVNRDRNGNYEIVPLAVLVEDNPYELFDPCPDAPEPATDE